MENTTVAFWEKVELESSRLHEFKAGDEFYEVSRGLAVGYRVLTDPVESVNGENTKRWSLTAMSETFGDVVEFMQTDGWEHLADPIYRKKKGGE